MGWQGALLFFEGKEMQRPSNSDKNMFPGGALEAMLKTDFVNLAMDETGALGV